MLVHLIIYFISLKKNKEENLKARNQFKACLLNEEWPLLIHLEINGHIQSKAFIIVKEDQKAAESQFEDFFKQDIEGISFSDFLDIDDNEDDGEESDY